jgi:hypothetical protein
MIVSRSFPFFLKLWKLMLSILTCFLWVGLAFVGFGDDVMIGASELNDVALKDGELMLGPDVDGIDASLMLSTNKGLVDIFTDECLLSPLHGTVYNIVEELFGSRHDGQVHVSSLFPNLLNSVVDIPIHCLCLHLSQSSQAMESVLHAF